MSAGSIYNKMKRPIAVLGSREAFIRICELCEVDPNNNDMFRRVEFVWDVDEEYCRVILVDGYDDLIDGPRVKSAAMGMVRNND